MSKLEEFFKNCLEDPKDYDVLALLDSITYNLPYLPQKYGKDYIQLERKVLETKLAHLQEAIPEELSDLEWIVQKLSFIQSDLVKDSRATTPPTSFHIRAIRRALMK